MGDSDPHQISSGEIFDCTGGLRLLLPIGRQKAEASDIIIRALCLLASAFLLKCSLRLLLHYEVGSDSSFVSLVHYYFSNAVEKLQTFYTRLRVYSEMHRFLGEGLT